MEIFDFMKRKDGRQGYFVTVNQKEALLLIRSLSSQLTENNANSGRLESSIKWTNGKKDKHDIYFTIAVSSDE